jgi:dihydrofolate reductase
MIEKGMHTMLIRTHVGVSLDGFMATPDGMPAWEAMPDFSPGAYGTAEFMEQSDAIVIGRSSFDQGFEAWLTDWPYSGKQVFVLTSSPLPANVPEGVVASQGGPAGLVKQLRNAGLSRVQVLGGARTIQAFLENAAIDRLGMVVLPVLLGKGIPLFAIEPTSFSNAALAASQTSATENATRPLRLDHQRAFPDGALELVYEGGSDEQES